jgi:periplasmic divalent cation tolerance protein
MAPDHAAAAAVLVLVTWPADRDAGALAHALLDARLAACVSVLPEMRSTYTWLGTAHVDAERQLIIKTTEDRVAALEARVREQHPYEVPEFLVLRVERGSDAYLAWLRDSTA